MELSGVDESVVQSLIFEDDGLLLQFETGQIDAAKFHQTFRNFFEAVTDKKEPISDVHSHHRALSTCHLAAIAARLNRPIRWNPEMETVIGDEQAQGFIARAPRKGFEIEI